MRRFVIPFIVILLAGCQQQAPEAKIYESSGPRHPVTEKMLAEAKRLGEKSAPDITGETIGGEAFSLKTALEKGPVVVFAILDGCPCSTDYQPIVNRLANRFDGKVTFLGLFDPDSSKAKTWIAKHEATHPVIADPSQKFLKAYGLERSVYTALIDRSGRVLKTWPGYWRDMLKELDGALQELTSQKLESFDTAYAPTTPSSGCQIFEGPGFSPGDVR